MRLIVWNSAGPKWGAFWKYYVGPALKGESVIGLLVEAGWAPWIKSGKAPGATPVPINTSFGIDRSSPRYQPDIADSNDAAMVADISESRRRKALWIPWVGNVDAITPNARCSIGAVLAPAAWLVQDVSVIAVSWFKRPVLRIMLGPGKDVSLTILLVHMISGWSKGAQQEMNYLTSSMASLIPEATSGIVVGDMNIDLNKTTPDLPPGWDLLHTKLPGSTQQMGGVLDYALLWDPHGAWPDADCQVLEQYGKGYNTSDHSVMVYPLDRGQT